MDNEQFREEENYLTQTILTAKDQLNQSLQTVEDLKDGILEAKKEIRENATHGIMNLNSSDDFEAVVELSQYMNPVRDQMVSLEEENKKIKRLEKIIQKPYFARIDFCFALDQETEKVYIGRFPLSDQKADLRYVYDWRSPIAGVFYQFPKGPAFYEAPYGQIDGEVTIKRQYEIKNEALAYYLDTDLNINDEILREALSQNASPKMKAIVETIQREQDTVIRDLSSELLMVQGTAGSGKTSIALHRAAYLMYQDLKSHLNADQILILSPNTAFEQYICQVLPELGEENVTTYTLEELLTQILKRGGIQTRAEQYEKLMRESLRENMTVSSGAEACAETLQSTPDASGRTSKTDTTAGIFIEKLQNHLDQFLIEIPQKWIAFRDISRNGAVVMTAGQMREWLNKRPSVPLGLRLSQLEEKILETAFGTAYKGHGEERQNLLQEIRSFTSLDILELYGRYINKDFQTGSIELEDAMAAAYLSLKIYGSGRKFKNFRQVLIDEAQDYSPFEFELFSLLFPSARFTVLGDIHQTVAKTGSPTLYQEIPRILGKKSATLITLKKSFRCTKEILDFALQFLKNRPEPKIESFNRSGDIPGVFTAPDQPCLISMITVEIDVCRKRGFRTICLLCKTQKRAIKLFQLLKKEGFDEEELILYPDARQTQPEGILVMPIYLAKGLEFDACLICDADFASYHTDSDRNLLYVACTRALHRLNLFYAGKPSPLFRERFFQEKTV